MIVWLQLRFSIAGVAEISDRRRNEVSKITWKSPKSKKWKNMQRHYWLLLMLYYLVSVLGINVLYAMYCMFNVTYVSKVYTLKYMYFMFISGSPCKLEKGIVSGNSFQSHPQCCTQVHLKPFIYSLYRFIFYHFVKEKMFQAVWNSYLQPV